MNQNTAFIDASQVYGSDKCDADDLREGSDGRLNVTLPHRGRGKHLLPKTGQNNECKAASGFCFKGGDARASEQPALAALHTIFLREHNRLVTKLKVSETMKDPFAKLFSDEQILLLSFILLSIADIMF